MRKLLATLFLAVFFLPCAQAQRPRTRDFSDANDSLRQRLKRRTGVDNAFKLEKVSARENLLESSAKQAVRQ